MYFFAGCPLGSLKDPSASTNARSHERLRVLYADGTAIGVTRTVEPQMRRTSMFSLKLSGYGSC